MSNKISRLNFLRIGTLVTSGTVLESIPGIATIAKALGVKPAALPDISFTCDFFRSDDLLYLRYYFYNARVNCGKIKKVLNNAPMFVYVQTPTQHIAEQLVSDPYKYHSRNDFKRLKSFASGGSPIAFKTFRKDVDIEFTCEELLEWTNNFSLVTIDDFVPPSKQYRTGYGQALDMIKRSIKDKVVKNKTGRLGNELWLDNLLGDKNVSWPLTTFEAPYKMFLSPIAEPQEFIEGTDEYRRKSGEHIFALSNKVRYEYEGHGFTIVRPWENRLIFRTNDNTDRLPRFKVVHWLCQDDSDSGVELLPTPLNRCELHNLTMLPAFDRDVWSELFQISSLGISADVFYKNDDPLKFSLIAWTQKIRYARDNFVSVTYRAIDNFTGLKLKISIIAERNYKYDVSFLPKLYFVSYAEEYKVYDEPVVISTIHCAKITPLIKGAYFFPTSVPSVPNAYAVDNQIAAHDKNFICNRLLDFEYLCEDKKGEVIKMKMKMIFIPAENYEIMSGVYNYCAEEDGTMPPPYHRSGNALVKLEHIGQLNPSKLIGQGNENSCNCETKDPINSCTGKPDAYTFRINKTFNCSQKTQLASTLSALRDHVSKNKDCYESKVDNKIAFGKIEKLKDKANEEAIRKDSTSATFPTRAVLLGETYPNATLYVQGRATADNYQARFPLVPGLMCADIIISQIDQIEGRSVTRNVSYAKQYRDGQREIDEYHDKNLAKLLWRLSDEDKRKLDNFFSDNYKNSGAMVNLGIEISHVSVFDQGITYNDEVNSAAARLAGSQKRSAVALRNSPSTLGNVSTISIFKPLKAEILGVPILDIVDEILPVKDLPVFSVIQQTNDTIEQINSTITEYADLVKRLKAEYDQDRQLLETLPAQIQLLENTLKAQLSGELKKWLDGLINRIGASKYYQTLQSKADLYKKYKNSFLTAAWDAITKQNPGIKDKIQKFVDRPSAGTFSGMLTELSKVPKDLPLYKEAIKIYVVQTVTDSAQYQEIQKQVTDLKGEVEDQYTLAYNAAIDSIAEASVFIQAYIDEQVKQLEEEVKETLQHIQSEFVVLLQKNGVKNVKVIVLICQLVSTFEHYANIYKNLKAENYQQIADDLGIPLPEHVIEEIKNELKKELNEELECQVTKIKEALPDIDLTPYQAYVGELKKQISEYENAFDHCVEIVKSINTEKVLEIYLRSTIENLEEYKRAKQTIEQYKQQYEDAKKEVEAFGRGFISQVKQELEKKKRELINAVKGSQEYNTIIAAINELERIIRKISEVAHQRLEHTFYTNRFRSASIGVIDFTPINSELLLHVVYDLEFDVLRLDQPPKIKKQSYFTETELRRFKLGFLQLVFFEFEKVRFVTGSDVKDDFQVKIKNVEFGGPLNFVQAFKSFLSSIDRNLVFDIDAEGAHIGYGIPLPNITAGYFNFFNFNLTALLTLPFSPKKSLQLNFGLGDELNKFGITVCGIFGGQGYFNIIVEPKRGVVGMILVLEFGAIFNLNLLLASGTACLVGGIYIKRYDGNVELRAYILCMGRFNVIGMFSASLSFYMGLHGNSHVLTGICEVIATCRFTRFFEISVTCGYEQTIMGAKSENNSQSQLLYKTPQRKHVYLENGLSLIRDKTQTASSAIKIIRTNVHYEYLHEGDEMYLVVAAASMSAVTARLPDIKGGMTERSFEVVRDNANLATTLIKFKLTPDMCRDPSLNSLRITIDHETYSVNLVVSDPKLHAVDTGLRERKIGRREYYAAYYH